MNLYEHTIIARQDISPSQIQSLKEKYLKLIEENKGNLVQTQEYLEVLQKVAENTGKTTSEIANLTT